MSVEWIQPFETHSSATSSVPKTFVCLSAEDGSVNTGDLYVRHSVRLGAGRGRGCRVCCRAVVRQQLYSQMFNVRTLLYTCHHVAYGRDRYTRTSLFPSREDQRVTGLEGGGGA